MNVIQRPGAVVFSADFPDYIIDTEDTISFSVKLNDTVILSEEYSPDAAYQVRIRKLGRFLAKALWGVWASGNSTHLDNVAGTFDFYINDVKDCSSFVLFSRCVSKRTASSSWPLSAVSEKVIRKSVPDYTSFYLQSGETVSVTADGAEGSPVTKTLYTHVGGAGVVTLATDYERIRGLLGSDVSVFSVGGMRFYVDKTSYAEKYIFRFRNNYDCTEIVCAVGSMVMNAEGDTETAFMAGIERKFVAKRADKFTVNSGVILRQSDYRLWYDFIHAQQASILYDGEWYDIIIAEHKYERDYRKNILKSVEFTFRLADPDNNGVL